MNELLPIIRRKRRPLIPVETVPVGPLKTEVVPTVNPPIEKSGTEETTKSDHAISTEDKSNSRVESEA